MTTITYALCAGRHEIIVDEENVTEKSVYPMNVKYPLDFSTNTETAREFILGLLNAEDKLFEENVEFQLVVTGLTSVLHTFLNAWQTTAPSHWVLTLGHYDRDEEVYKWESIFRPGMDLSNIGKFVPHEE